MERYIFIIGLLVCSLGASAQISLILGKWKTVDDKTGKNYAVVSIYQSPDGLYYGRISQLLVGPKDLVCDQCEGEDHNAPIEGLVIMRRMKYDAKKNQLVGGKVLDPESGKFYYGKIYPKDGKLILRGSLDKHGIFGRNQTWIRAK